MFPVQRFPPPAINNRLARQGLFFFDAADFFFFFFFFRPAQSRIRCAGDSVRAADDPDPLWPRPPLRTMKTWVAFSSPRRRKPAVSSMRASSAAGIVSRFFDLAQMELSKLAFDDLLPNPRSFGGERAARILLSVIEGQPPIFVIKQIEK